MHIITNKYSLKILLIALLFLGYGTQAIAQKGDGTYSELSIAKTIHDKDLKWNPAPDFFPGCTFTILNGDITKPNLDFFFKIEPNTEVIKHTHNSPERMILISGELEVTYENEPTSLLKAGTYAYGPAGKPHKAKCLNKGPCVLFIALVDPFNAIPIGK
ncbi:cupin domain-containing protein [Mangrovimonas sp. YM274]|uniref:cupin domain-containing protein n=1 Tax=Mangrovimonas sp. YM274 TaxID=3070660 RepID=UPI0027DDEECA|nr:cupin domain-containing protein [Mangrovimonas sp. YM274]WMI69657.1 cupin domain-containing protein [Mangrovimonas sp. YM274]